MSFDEYVHALLDMKIHNTVCQWAYFTLEWYIRTLAYMKLKPTSLVVFKAAFKNEVSPVRWKESAEREVVVATNFDMMVILLSAVAAPGK